MLDTLLEGCDQLTSALKPLPFLQVAQFGKTQHSTTVDFLTRFLNCIASLWNCWSDLLLPLSQYFECGKGD